MSLKDVVFAFARKLLRIVPVYWAIFFLSWGLYPRSVNGGPDWFISANLFQTCKDDWWARVLLIGNLVPYFTAPIYGCFFWAWVIEVDIQLSLVVPIFVYAYLKNPKLGHVIIVLSTMIGIAVNELIVDYYGYKVGWLASGNWTALSYLIEKPWNHIAAMCIGIYFAYVYQVLLKYR